MSHYMYLGATAKAKSQKRNDDFVAKLNKDLSHAFSLVLQAGTILPGLSAKQKEQMQKQPLNFVLDLFDPFRVFFKDVLDRVMLRTGKEFRNVLGIKVRVSPHRNSVEKDMLAKNPELFDFYDALNTWMQVQACLLTCLPIFTDEMFRKSTKQPVYRGPELIPFSDIGAASDLDKRRAMERARARAQAQANAQHQRQNLGAASDLERRRAIERARARAQAEADVQHQRLSRGLGAAGVDDAAAALAVTTALAPAILPLINTLLQSLLPMLLAPPPVDDPAAQVPSGAPPPGFPPPPPPADDNPLANPLVLAGVAGLIAVLVLKKKA